jgi:uncharacterized protein (TIGR02145 family)
MKKYLFLALILGAMLSSCSKKSTPAPQQLSSTVTINGTDYKTAVIGNQTWTTVNYNGTGGVNYNNSATNIPANGKLYTLEEAKAIAVPTGWRLPSQDDYNALVATLGATKASDENYTVTAATAYKLMATASWTTGGGTNSSAFNALAIGYNHRTVFDGAGTDAVFITTSTLISEPAPASFNIYQDNTGTSAVLTDIVLTSTDRASIRFVKDN